MLSNAKQTYLRQTPPFRGDHVGSLLRPEVLKQARLEKAKGEITAQQLRAIEDEQIKRVVEKQKAIGLKSITDGEFRRAWWHFDFLENLDGVEPFEAEEGLHFHQMTTKARGIKVTGKIGFSTHPMLEDYRFLHGIAGEYTAKMTIPSPNMLYFRAQFDESPYDDQEAFFHDLSTAYQKAIQAFYDAGCRYLQLDDTAWAHLCSEEQKEELRAKGLDPDQVRANFARLINAAVANKPDDMAITMHICRGNFRSTFMFSGGYEPVAETLFTELNVDGLFLEFDSERSGGFEPLRYLKRPNLQVVLGLVTSKFGELEAAETIKHRIDEASRYVPLDQLCLSPQCGFASTEEGNLLTEEQQWDKLRHVLTIADEVWA
ncbi:hypothetical protein GCM10011391_05320 [Pullulanibacillus camelliae]|uniref:Cobalamin-independent methionine synthase MetE C-terminal/archaeal domain-containing protein n=1 Tax=Pullulanibacillus camelliae TaxID=1707096 RepID=A0A8J2VL26_9BACL|nr:5-methyltetrahydropteroyltriglutamate--homocysteine S-methyltransferase [Pullulanibacillus camelliae]GGE29717.1 hypothetical protein GCM10011391_05320 [Pullulanibacillus camelliae]